jgi:hypothetical protein
MIKNAQRNVEDVNVELINVIDFDFKNYYIVFILKIFVRMKSDIRYIALLNTEVEINIIIKKMMHKKTYLCDRARLLIWFLILIISKSFWAFVKMWRLTSRISLLSIIFLWLRKSIMFWYSIRHFYERTELTWNEEINIFI